MTSAQVNVVEMSVNFNSNSPWTTLTRTILIFTYLKHSFVHNFPFLRTTFTYLSGITTYLVAWAILGQRTGDRISAKSFMDFTVTYTQKYFIQFRLHTSAQQLNFIYYNYMYIFIQMYGAFVTEYFLTILCNKVRIG